MHIRIPTLFRIWYSTTYTVLFFILLIFLAVTPGDTIYQSIRTRELQKLFIIGAVYAFTFFVSLLVYSTRLYTNRVVLQAIPKPYIPVEDGEVGKLVRRVIVKALKRSAIIAYDSRPRDVRDDPGYADSGASRPQTAERNNFAHRRRNHAISATVIPVSVESPPWGHVSHPGWASPSSLDLPNLQYGKVVMELPNLIEAKAVSLAPPDPAVEDHLRIQENTPILPDADIVAVLQRPRTMGLREYLGRLASFGLINPGSLGPKFLTQYEYARFSTNPLTESEFRDLMATFTEILNGMTELDPDFVKTVREESETSDSRSVSSAQTSSSSTTSGLPYRTPRMQSRAEYGDNASSSYQDGTESPQTLRTAPSMPRNSSSGFYTMPRTPSERSLGSGSVIIRPVQRSPSTVFPNSSSSSLGSGGSVIRLHPSPGQGDLPYQYHSDVG
jgi:hypothetical protein